MHELAATESLLELVLKHAREHQAQKVLRVAIRKGELNDYVDETIRWLFDTLSAETIAAGAELEFEPLPIVFSCRKCGRKFHVQRQFFEAQCDGCGSVEVELIGGREFYLDTMDIE